MTTEEVKRHSDTTASQMRKLNNAHFNHGDWQVDRMTKRVYGITHRIDSSA